MRRIRCWGGAAATAAATTSAVQGAPAIAASALEVALGADGELVLRGTVADEATCRALVEAAQAHHGASKVIDELRIRAPSAQSLRLTGEVTDAAARTAWGEAFSAALAARSPAWSIDNALTVKGLPVETTPAPAPAPAPKAIVYFSTGKADISAEAREQVAEVNAYLKANPERKAVLSGFHDPRGNKVANEALAKSRAKSVRELLRAAGIEEARIELRKPVETTGDGSLAEARRVELSVE